MIEKTAPESCILLIGPPRSGTTLIANTFMSHSRVSGVMEPWQARRRDDFTETDPDRFIAATNPGDLSAAPHLAIKETTTRQANVDMSLELLHGMAARDVYTGLVLILRCPFAAYLSQVEASSNMWGEKKLTEVSQRTFAVWANSLRKTLGTLSNQARAQHFRVVSYEAFCARPAAETARLMALIPERLEPARQLSFRPPKDMRRGGDPKTREKAGKIARSDRGARITALKSELGRSPEMRFMNELRRIVMQSACQIPDREVMDQLSRLVA